MAGLLTKLRVERYRFKLVQVGPESAVTGPQLATILNISEQRVRQLIQQGMPKVCRGVYPLQQCIWWYASYCKRYGHARKRKKIDEKFRHLRVQKLYLRNELRALKIGKISNGLVAETLSNGIALLIHFFDSELRSLSSNLKIQFGWSETDRDLFEHMTTCAKDDFVFSLRHLVKDRIVPHHLKTPNYEVGASDARFLLVRRYRAGSK